MSEFIEIRWTCATIDEGRKVARYLVQERLVACAQIVPWLESIYMWNNQLETTQESKVLLKTHRRHYERIVRTILENSTYQVPEIIYFTIEGGNPSYMQWLADSTPGFSENTSPKSVQI